MPNRDGSEKDPFTIFFEYGQHSRDKRDLFDRPPRRRKKYGPLDKMFIDTPFPVLILFGFCFNFVALIMAVICLSTVTHPVAKSRATMVMILSSLIVTFFMIPIIGRIVLR